MDMANNKAVLECPHGIHQNVAGNSLHDVFDKLGTVAFEALPFFCGPDTFIGNGFPAETVLADTGFHIGKGRDEPEDPAVFNGA